MSTPHRPRRQQQRAIDTRQRILDTAGELIVMDSYEGTSVGDLIAAARTSKGAFYRHFPGGKVDVAAAIMENTLTMDGLREQSIMLQEVVDIGMILAYRISHENALRAALKLSLHSNAPETYGTPWPDWIAFNTGQLAEARRRGELKPFVDVEQQAYQIAGNWAGVVLISNIIDRDMGNVEERISRMYRNLVTAVAVPDLLPEIDFSVHRGRHLYTAFLEDPAGRGEPADPQRSQGGPVEPDSPVEPVEEDVEPLEEDPE
ncbi:TetR family transcriptional regulator [Streptomyces sp. NPDC059627]